MTSDALLISQDGQVLRVILNRPQRLNALSGPLIRELRDLFSGLYSRRDVRVVLLGGEGSTFCAGLDLKDLASGEQGRMANATENLLGQRAFAEVIIAMRRCPQPIIAMIDGAASGAGFALALASDVRIVTPSARMNAAFIRIGLSACDLGVSYLLPRHVGTSVAAEYLLTGRFIGADRALQLGLVSQVVPRERLESEAELYARDMLRATPLGLALTKETLNLTIDAPSLEAATSIENRNQLLCAASEDFREGVSAFLERRQPNYPSLAQ